MRISFRLNPEYDNRVLIGIYLEFSGNIFSMPHCQKKLKRKYQNQSLQVNIVASFIISKIWTCALSRNYFVSW